MLFGVRCIFFLIFNCNFYCRSKNNNNTIPNKIVERLYVILDNAFIFHAGFQNVPQINTLQKELSSGESNIHLLIIEKLLSFSVETCL